MSAADRALDDERRAATAGLLNALSRAETEARSARLTLHLHREDGNAVDVAQLDATLNRALNAARALDEARAMHLAAHGRGRTRT